MSRPDTDPHFGRGDNKAISCSSILRMLAQPATGVDWQRRVAPPQLHPAAVDLFAASTTAMEQGRSITTLTLDQYRAALAAGSQTPHRGLPDAVFDFALQIVPMINVDLFVRDEIGRTLMAWRDDRFGTGWHIPGGIIRHRETFQARIAQVAHKELHAAVAAEAAPCHVVEIVDEERGHFISMLFRCHLRERLSAEAGLIAMGTTPRPGDLAWSAGVPDALYPSHRIYRDWLGPAPATA